MKVALYARVSTRDKDQNPEVQLSAMRDYCQRQGYEIIGEYVDKASAADFVRRESWVKLMKHAATRKFKGVLAWKLDRVFRDTVMALTVVRRLRAWGIDLHLITQPELSVAGPAGDLMLTIYAGFAQFEKDQIRERVNAGIALARKEGKVFGRRPAGVDVAKVCNAYHKAGEGRGRWARTAEIIREETGLKMSRGFAHKRLSRAAEVEGMTVDEYVTKHIFSNIQIMGPIHD
ncbi:MAG: recombinase family protein [Dehalogenimonas sp.]